MHHTAKQEYLQNHRNHSTVAGCTQLLFLVNSVNCIQSL